MSKVSCSGISVDGSGILEMGNTWKPVLGNEALCQELI